MALALARCSLSLAHGCTGTRPSPRPTAPRAVRCCSAQGGRGSKRPGWLDSLRGGSGDGGGGGSSSGDVKPAGQQEQSAYVQLLLGVAGTILVVTGQAQTDRKQLQEELEKRNTQLRTEIQKTNTQLRTEIEKTNTQLGAKIDALAAASAAKIDALAAASAAERNNVSALRGASELLLKLELQRVGAAPDTVR